MQGRSLFALDSQNIKLRAHLARLRLEDVSTNYQSIYAPHLRMLKSFSRLGKRHPSSSWSVARRRTFSHHDFLRSDATSDINMDADPESVPITAEPKQDQLVEHNGTLFKTIREGKAYILVPPNARTSVNPQAKAQPGMPCPPLILCVRCC